MAVEGDIHHHSRKLHRSAVVEDIRQTGHRAGSRLLLHPVAVHMEHILHRLAAVGQDNPQRVAGLDSLLLLRRTCLVLAVLVADVRVDRGSEC